jgi:hypothetical protein
MLPSLCEAPKNMEKPWKEHNTQISEHPLIVARDYPAKAEQQTDIDLNHPSGLLYFNF